MNGSKGNGRRGVLASLAMLGAILTILLLPAYGQQEVNPTWYDPWAAPNAAVVHPAQTAAVAHSSQLPATSHWYPQTVKFVSPGRDAGKIRVKDTRLDKAHNAARKSGDITSGN